MEFHLPQSTTFTKLFFVLPPTEHIHTFYFENVLKLICLIETLKVTYLASIVVAFLPFEYARSSKGRSSLNLSLPISLCLL